MSNLLTFTGGELRTNAFFLEAPEGGILFDAPEGVAEWLASKSLRPSLLLLTHTHFDHILGAAEVQKTFGCPIACHRACPPAPVELALTRMLGIPLDCDEFTPDFLLDEAASVRFLGAEFATFHVPGHHPGSICFLHRDSSALFGGDVLFAGGVGRWDLPGGDHDTLIQGIREKLLPLPESTIVYPGHGPATTIGREKFSNPYIQD